MFREVLDALHRLESEAAKDGERRVAQSGECLWRMAGVGACLILTVGDVAHVVQAVLDTPVFAGQGEQTLGTGPVGGQAGDGVDRLGGGVAAYDALACQAAHLREAAPSRCQVFSDAGGDLQPAGFYPAMRLLDRFGLSEVRRRRPDRGGGESGPKARAMSAFSVG